jgi:hypothetical protein
MIGTIMKAVVNPVMKMARAKAFGKKIWLFRVMVL